MLEILFRKFNVIVEKESSFSSYGDCIIGPKGTIYAKAEGWKSSERVFSLEPNILKKEENIYTLKELSKGVSEFIKYIGVFKGTLPIMSKIAYCVAIGGAELSSSPLAPDNESILCNGLIDASRFWVWDGRDIRFEKDARRLRAYYFMCGAHVNVYIYLDCLTQEKKNEIFRKGEFKTIEDVYRRSKKMPWYKSKADTKEKLANKEEEYDIHLFPHAKIPLQNYAEDRSRIVCSAEGDMTFKHCYIIDASIPVSHINYGKQRFEYARMLVYGNSISIDYKLSVIMQFYNLYAHYHKEKDITHMPLEAEKVLEICRKVRLAFPYTTLEYDKEAGAAFAEDLESEVVAIESGMLSEYIRLVYESKEEHVKECAQWLIMLYDAYKKFTAGDGAEFKRLLKENGVLTSKDFEKYSKDYAFLEDDKEEIIKKLFTKQIN